MPGQQPVRCLAGRAGGAKDRATIFPQDAKPSTDIVGMANGGRDAERGAQESRTHLGDQFLAGIILAAEGIAKIARQPLGMACRVGQFMKTGAVVIDLIEEGGLRRHSDEIGTGRIIGFIAANAEFAKMLRAATGRDVIIEAAGTGTSIGAALLAGKADLRPSGSSVPDPGPQWRAYADAWRVAVSS